MIKVIKIDFDDFIKSINQNNSKNDTIEMIKDTEEICKSFNDANSNEDIIVKLKNAAIAFANAEKFDKEDVKNIGIEETGRYYNILQDILGSFNSFANYQLNNISKLVAEVEKESSEENDGLENLTKEELIARLREKSK